MKPAFLVAVDPGLDAAGVAVFDLGAGAAPGTPMAAIAYPEWRPGEAFQQAMRRLCRYEVIRTSPEWPLPRRLGMLARGLREIVPDGSLGHSPAYVVLERSRIPGVYAQARRRQQTKNAINAAALEKLFFAIGALVSGAEAVTELVELVHASPVPKKTRAKLVLYQLRWLGHPLARRSRLSPDLLDAIGIGATWLSTARLLRAGERVRRADGPEAVLRSGGVPSHLSR